LTILEGKSERIKKIKILNAVGLIMYITTLMVIEVYIFAKSPFGYEDHIVTKEEFQKWVADNQGLLIFSLSLWIVMSLICFCVMLKSNKIIQESVKALKNEGPDFEMKNCTLHMQTVLPLLQEVYVVPLLVCFCSDLRC